MIEGSGMANAAVQRAPSGVDTFFHKGGGPIVG
jgi:hypothetical protein